MAVGQVWPVGTPQQCKRPSLIAQTDV